MSNPIGRNLTTGGKGLVGVFCDLYEYQRQKRITHYAVKADLPAQRPWDFGFRARAAGLHHSCLPQAPRGWRVSMQVRPAL